MTALLQRFWARLQENKSVRTGVCPHCGGLLRHTGGGRECVYCTFSKR